MKSFLRRRPFFSTPRVQPFYRSQRQPLLRNNHDKKAAPGNRKFTLGLGSCLALGLGFLFWKCSSEETRGVQETHIGQSPNAMTPVLPANLPTTARMQDSPPISPDRISREPLPASPIAPAAEFILDEPIDRILSRPPVLHAIPSSGAAMAGYFGLGDIPTNNLVYLLDLIVGNRDGTLSDAEIPAVFSHPFAEELLARLVGYRRFSPAAMGQTLKDLRAGKRIPLPEIGEIDHLHGFVINYNEWFAKSPQRPFLERHEIRLPSTISENMVVDQNLVFSSQSDSASVQSSAVFNPQLLLNAPLFGEARMLLPAQIRWQSLPQDPQAEATRQKMIRLELEQILRRILNGNEEATQLDEALRRIDQMLAPFGLNSASPSDLIPLFLTHFSLFNENYGLRYGPEKGHFSDALEFTFVGFLHYLRQASQNRITHNNMASGHYEVEFFQNRQQVRFSRPWCASDGLVYFYISERDEARDIYTDPEDHCWIIRHEHLNATRAGAYEQTVLTQKIDPKTDKILSDQLESLHFHLVWNLRFRDGTIPMFEYGR